MSCASRMEEKKTVNHAAVATEGRIAWMAAWDASWLAADRAASDAAKRLASRSECRAAWAAVIMAARELTLPPESNQTIRAAWAAAWETAIVVSGASLEKRYQKKTVYSPPIALAAAWDVAWAQAITAGIDILVRNRVEDSNNTRLVVLPGMLPGMLHGARRLKLVLLFLKKTE